VGEPSAGRLVSLHNLTWLGDLVASARLAVVEGRFSQFQRQVTETWGPRVPSGATTDPLG